MGSSDRLHPDVTSYDEVLSDLMRGVGREFRVDDLTPATRLREDLRADSLDLLSFLIDIEDRYGVQVTDDELLGLQTIAEAAAFITSRQA